MIAEKKIRFFFSDDDDDDSSVLSFALPLASVLPLPLTERPRNRHSNTRPYKVTNAYLQHISEERRGNDGYQSQQSKGLGSLQKERKEKDEATSRHVVKLVTDTYMYCVRLG